MGILFTVTRHHQGAQLDRRSQQRVRKALAFFSSDGRGTQRLWRDSVLPSLIEAPDPTVRQAAREASINQAKMGAWHERVEELVQDWLTAGSLGEKAARELGRLLNLMQATYPQLVTAQEGILIPAIERSASMDQSLAKALDAAVDSVTAHPPLGREKTLAR